MNLYTVFYLCLFLTFTNLAEAQTERVVEDVQIIEPSPTSIVKQFKDNLNLTLIVDSIIVGRKKIIPHFKTTLQISYESDYIQMIDSFYIKIFIARTQEYGSKFYMWQWDFLKKRAGKFISQGRSEYETMDFGNAIDPKLNIGHGVGVEGTSDYIMYYYKYRLE
jgi:hypothetical protein